MMTAFRSKRLGAAAGVLLMAVGLAQPDSSPTGTRPPAVPPRPPVASLAPDPPHPSTPVDNFRRLLAAGETERQAVLGDRSPAQREYLVGQLAEFDSLTPAEREARLRLLELRYYLGPLLVDASQGRTNQFLLVPPAYRAAVRDRLLAWESLSSALRAELIEDHAALRRLLLFPGAVAAPDPAGTGSLAPPDRARFDRAVARLRDMGTGERQALAEHLHRFFQFSDAEQQRALAQVDAGPRARLEQLVAELDGLPASEREQCLESLKRFARLSLPEQERFLRNALRWAAMSPEDRQVWRQVHANLPPIPPEIPPSPGTVQALR